MITKSRINKEVDSYLFSEYLIWNWQIQISWTYISSIVSWHCIYDRSAMRTSVSGHLPPSSKQLCKVVSLTAHDFRRGEGTKNGISSIENCIYFIERIFDIVIHIYMCIYTYVQMQFHYTLDNAFIGFNAFENASGFKGDFCLLNDIIFSSSVCFSIHRNSFHVVILLLLALPLKKKQLECVRTLTVKQRFPSKITFKN